MAKDARMLHLNISKSLQVDSLPLPARLLFTWMIAHADDDGRLKGDPKYVKGCVVPLTNWSPKNIKKYLDLMKEIGLIHYWQENNQWFVEFVKWRKFQKIRADRFRESDLPSFDKKNDNQLSTSEQPSDNQTEAEANISESNSNELNKSEPNGEEQIADKNPSYKGSDKEGRVNYPTSGETPAAGNNSPKRAFADINPDTFVPETREEAAAVEVWKKLEPNNKFSFFSTYLKPIRKGLPPDLLYQFSSEIKQDPEIKNPGAVMNKKIKDYFEGKESGAKQ